MRSRPRWNLTLRTLLLVFLLAAQGMSLAHQSGHTEVPDTVNCDFCLSCSELEYSTLDVAPQSRAIPGIDSPAFSIGTDDSSTPCHTPEARAPPACR